jgi:hypothetical protein
MSAHKLTITWHKLKTTPDMHEQWEAVGVDAMIRKLNDFEFSAHYKTKLIGGCYPNLRAAKWAIETMVIQ